MSVDKYGQGPVFINPDHNEDWQFENPIIAVDFDTGETVGKKLFKEGEAKMESEPKNRAEEVRELLPMDKLGGLLETKSRKEICEETEQEPEEPEEGTILEVKECQCTKDAALIAEIAALREEVERLKKITAAVQAFAYRHRHQIGAGHYSEWGIAD